RRAPPAAAAAGSPVSVRIQSSPGLGQEGRTRGLSLCQKRYKLYTPFIQREHSMATATKAKKTATPARKSASAKPASRAAVKPPVKPAGQPAPKAAAQPAPAPKPDKPKKAKLVRDSFTIPKAEYAVLAQLKLRAAQSGTPAKKSELLRAGLKVLAGMEDAAFLAALRAVPALKTGRPAGS